jgi:hypothetical protein
MRKFHRVLAAVALFALASCQGPDPVRLASERANWKLTQRCADGWFGGLPFTAQDERVVRGALDDWDKALTADEALVQWPLGGAK